MNKNLAICGIIILALITFLSMSIMGGVMMSPRLSYGQDSVLDNQTGMNNTTTTTQPTAGGNLTVIEEELNNNTQTTSDNTTITAPTTIDFNTTKQQYLSAWNNTDFHSEFDTFIEAGSHQGYALFKERGHNVFESGETIETIELYVEPVGFTHKPVFDETENTTMYSINVTAKATILDSEGKELRSIEEEELDFYSIPEVDVTSHRKNLEASFVISLTPDPPLPEGEYVIRYIVQDGTSGKNFEIEKDIRIVKEFIFFHNHL